MVTLALPELGYVKWLITRSVRNALHGQGIGRHSTEEIKHILLTDLQALADYLGR